MSEHLCARPLCRTGPGYTRETEDRINGYCSCQCEDMHDLESEIERLRTILKEWPSLECPCCGEEAAMAAYFQEGDETICGCGGIVTVGDPEERAYITLPDEPCPKCGSGEGG